MSVISYRSPRARSDATAVLGMTVFLGSWAIMFAALFFGYATIRVRLASWPPAGLPPLPLALPGLNTVVLAGSGVMLQRALGAARAGNSSVRRDVVAAALLGTVFLGLQFLLWIRMWQAGLRPEAGPYPSVFWALTVFHALHVLVGLGGLCFVAARASSYIPARHLSLRLWTTFWHFIGAVWLLLFVSVFVL